MFEMQQVNIEGVARWFKSDFNCQIHMQFYRWSSKKQKNIAQNEKLSTYFKVMER